MNGDYKTYLQLSIKGRPPYRIMAEFKNWNFSALHVPPSVANLKFASNAENSETFTALDLEERVMFFLCEGRTSDTEFLWDSSDSITLLEDGEHLSDELDDTMPLYVIHKPGTFSSLNEALIGGAVLTHSEGLAKVWASETNMSMNTFFLNEEQSSKIQGRVLGSGDEVVGIHLLALHEIQTTYGIDATNRDDMIGMRKPLNEKLQTFLPSNLANACSAISANVDGFNEIVRLSKHYTETDPYRFVLSEMALILMAQEQKKFVNVEDLTNELPLVPAGARIKECVSDHFLPSYFPKGHCLVQEYNNEISVIALKVPHGARQYCLYSGEALTNLSALHVAKEQEREIPTAPNKPKECEPTNRPRP